jgi:hypothetical protein
MEKNSSAGGGIGFWGMLQIVFIVLKLTHIIDWPWVWVLAPAWIGVIITVIVLVVVFIIWRKWR